MAVEAVQHGEGAGEKGLRGGAVGFLSGVVIGVASTAPGYSLAASLGFVAAVGGMGVHSPAIMILAFIPMLFTAAAYYYLNRADPDCGTSFSWVTRAFGPWAGWIAGWAILVADIIVMANLSEVAGIYTWDLIGVSSGRWMNLIVGVLWIVLMTWICYVGIEASAKLQWYLLGAELVTLALFAVVALVKVYTMDISGSMTPSLEWFNPFSLGSGALASGVILAIFIYWGWDSTVCVNEESEDATEAPGKAAVLSTFVLLGIYSLVTVAAQAYHGAGFLADDKHSGDVLGALGSDVLGNPLAKLIVIAVLTSAAASTQTTILPTTRTVLSMAAKGAAPKYFGKVHPNNLTPSTATIWFGVISIVWYVGLKIASENILNDAIAALGLMIALYYGMTAFACPWYYRKVVHPKNVRNFLLVVVAPIVGGAIMLWAFVRSVIDYADPANSESGQSWFGLGPPLVIIVAFMLLGVVLMFWMSKNSPAFFHRHSEVALEGALDVPGGAAQTPLA